MHPLDHRRPRKGTNDETAPNRADASLPPNGHPTTPAATNLGEIATRLERGSGLLVAVDFDGTLAPIATDPDRPQITPENRIALSRLSARNDAVVAVVSGRELADLRSRAEVPGAIYAGNHGFEVARGTDRVVHPAARRYRPALDRARTLVRRALADIPGCLVEDKTLSLTVHYRQVPAAYQPAVTDRIASLAPRLDDCLRLVSGRKSVEIRPRIDWDKGRAVQWIRATLPTGYGTVYLGDDTTDEDVFRTLRAGDVGVHVGSRDTDAEFRLASQRDVAPFLDWLGRRVTPGVGSLPG
ncbi:trehalose-phosphatase (plasmid) [Halorientalis pallida]|uniref:trehalose-phosphatase n=1 Tax=Halorientalis pallida TaxID=2479928 RepID=UPI003C6F1742